MLRKLRLLAPLQERMKAQRVLLTTDGAHCDNILKIKPPLVFSCRDADRLVAVLEVRAYRFGTGVVSRAMFSRIWACAPWQAVWQVYFLLQHRRRWRSLLA